MYKTRLPTVPVGTHPLPLSLSGSYKLWTRLSSSSRVSGRGFLRFPLAPPLGLLHCGPRPLPPGRFADVHILPSALLLCIGILLFALGTFGSSVFSTLLT